MLLLVIAVTNDLRVAVTFWFAIVATYSLVGIIGLHLQ